MDAKPPQGDLQPEGMTPLGQVKLVALFVPALRAQGQQLPGAAVREGQLCRLGKWQAAVDGQPAGGHVVRLRVLLKPHGDGVQAVLGTSMSHSSHCPGICQ